MPQLDLFSYFSAATTLVFGFLFLVFVLHTYFLPKLATTLKFRKKVAHKQVVSAENSNTSSTDKGYNAILTLAQTYVNELEKVLKTAGK